MNTGHDQYAIRKILDLTRAASIVLILLHIYSICYVTFQQWGLSSDVTGHVLAYIAKTGLFRHVDTDKLWSLVFLLISLIGFKRRENMNRGYTSSLLLAAVGLILYFGSDLLLRDPSARASCLYMGTCFTGWILTLTGGMRLSNAIGQGWLTGRQVKEGGFLQERRLIETDFSINLKSSYEFNGKTFRSHLNVINPRRGILLIGSGGSGKSWFIVEPTIEQMTKRGFSMLVFDYKYDSLTSYTYTQFCKNRDAYPENARFYNINFTDLTRSHRCNLIAPGSLRHLSDAIGASRTIMLSLNKKWAEKQGDFFVESAVNFLAALIWYLKKYKDGAYCTLPHAIELAQTPYEKLFAVLMAEPDIQTLVGPFIEVWKNKTFEVLDSQLSSVKIPLGRLASSDLYYILTGNDLTLDINNPADMKVVCLGGDPGRQDALAPILSLYIDRINKLINVPRKHPCVLVLDEFGSVRATSVLQTISVGRAHNIIPFLVIQDISQLQILYSRAEADAIFNMTGNLICGQTGGDTARWVSQRFPTITQHKTTVSTNSYDTSVSETEQMLPSITPSTLATLSSGEFVGILADDPGKEMEFKAFHAKIEKEEVEDELLEVPVVREIKDDELDRVFRGVKQDVREIVEGEMKRIMRDPKLKGLL